MTPAIRIAGVTKRFRSLQALAGVDLEVAPGEFFGLPGHVRIGFGGDADQLERALGRFADALRRYRPS